MIPENTPIYSNNYYEIMIGTFTWNEFLSQSSWGLDFFSYRFFFWAICLPLGINIIQLLILERILFFFLAFVGAFFLSKDYLCKSLKYGESKLALIVSYIAGIVYGVNPSFMVGDSFWMGIQFSFISLPWIIFSFNKVILDKNWKYALLCAFLLSLNIDEHFLWVGFPILLVLYAGFIFFAKFLKEKKVDFRPISSFLLVILIFAGLVSYRLIARLIAISPYSLSITKLGVDVCWTHASLLNMLRAMSHMDLSSMYVTTHPMFSFLNSLMPLTLLIPIFALTSLLYKRNWVTLFYGTLLIVFILPFFAGSPFKWLHYWVFFNTPFGPAFRTWRVPDAFIALSLSVLSAFSLCYIFQKLLNKKKILTIFMVLGMIFVLSIYSWPLLTGDVNGRLAAIEVPSEYFEAYSFLSNQTGDFRIMHVPDFIYSYGKYTNLKPFWSTEWGAIQEFLTFSSPKQTFWPIGHWGHFYDFTLSPFYHSLLRKGDVDTLSHFLEWANIKYIVIHNDIPAMEEAIKNYINFLSSSITFKLVFHDNFIYIYENQLTEKKIDVSSHVILVNGGYRAIKKFISTLNNSETNYHYIFIDQEVPFELLEKAKTILTDKPREQLTEDLIFAKIISDNPNYAIYPYNYIIEHDPNHKWSRASYLDPHQQVWHPYVNWEDYAWDFDYGKGLAFTINSNDSMAIPIDLQTSEEYVLLLRYFANEKGGKITLDIENKTLEMKTLHEYNGFFWYKDFINLNKGIKQ
ncbi:MAG: hypothetical protein OEW87_10620, partial [Flavobacteriaceae bacterium]|nr:hypothetical protein [Flavobacteriaceae bacterium]